MSRLQHKRGRKSNYLKSLNNEYQRTARERCLIRDNFQCRLCGSRIYLEWHHITYYYGGKSILGTEQENLEWTVMVCETCHQTIHNDLNHKWNPKNRNKQSA